MEPMTNSVLTEESVVRLWKERICLNPDVDPSQEHDWFSLWCGFVIGLNRADLATDHHYMMLGFPEELNPDEEPS